MRTLLPFHPALTRHTLVLDPPMTDAELEEFIRLNEPARIERFGKEVIQMNAPAGGDTSSGNADISGQLYAWWLTHRRGRVFDSSGGFYLLDGSLLSPDTSYLTAASLATLTKADRRGYYRICPEFIIELRSTSDRLGELKKKMQLWMANGVQLGWLVNPDRKEVLVYKAGAPQPEIFSGPELPGSGPVEGFHLNLIDVWDCYQTSFQSERQSKSATLMTACRSASHALTRNLQRLFYYSDCLDRHHNRLTGNRFVLHAWPL